MFREYASRLVRLGCEVKVITSNSGGIEGRLSYDGVDTHYFRWRSLFGHPIPNPKDLYKFVDWSDVVHAATYTAAPVALSVSKRLNRPCMVTVYEALGSKWFWVEKNFLKSLMFYLFEQYVIKRRYSHFHAISFATRDDLIAKGIDKRLITTIYPGLDARFLGSSNNLNHNDQGGPGVGANRKPKVFMYFGRPGKTKGIFVLLDAINRTKYRLPGDFKFVFILGKEPISENEKLKRLVARNGLNHIVEIIDPLPDEALVEAVKEAFCIIIPSVTEGFGYTAAESCSLGKPVIASDAGSLPEVVFGRILFFQNRNSADLAEKILMASRGEFMDIPVKTFDWDVSTQTLKSIYETLIDDNRPNRESQQ